MSVESMARAAPTGGASTSRCCSTASAMRSTSRWIACSTRSRWLVRRPKNRQMLLVLGTQSVKPQSSRDGAVGAEHFRQFTVVAQAQQVLGQRGPPHGLNGVGRPSGVVVGPQGLKQRLVVREGEDVWQVRLADDLHLPKGIRMYRMRIGHQEPRIPVGRPAGLQSLWPEIARSE